MFTLSASPYQARRIWSCRAPTSGKLRTVGKRFQSVSLFPLTPIMRIGFDPVPELGAVRAEQPVVKLEIPGGPSAWLLTRYEDVRATLADTIRFSNAFEN